MAKPFNHIKFKIGLDDTLTFGKYIGVKVSDLITDDPDYLRYMDTKGIKFYPSVIELLLEGYYTKEKDDTPPYFELNFDDVPY